MLSDTQREIDEIDINQEAKQLLNNMTNEEFRLKFLMYYKQYNDYSIAFNKTIIEMSKLSS